MFCRARRVLHSTFYIQDVVRVEAIERAAVHDSLAERAGSVQPLMHQPGQSKCWMLGCEQQGGRDRGTVPRPKVTVAAAGAHQDWMHSAWKAWRQGSCTDDAGASSPSEFACERAPGRRIHARDDEPGLRPQASSLTSYIPHASCRGPAPPVSALFVVAYY